MPAKIMGAGSDSGPLIACAGGWALLWALLPWPAAAEDWTPFVRADSFTYAGPVTINQYLHKWNGELKRDGNALTYNWFESGEKAGPFLVSYVSRYDYEIKANHDSALLYYQTQNRLPLNPGQSYALDVRVYHQRSWGERFEYTAPALKTLQIAGGITALRAEGLLDGSIRGNASVVSANTYNYDAQLNEYYSRDYILKRNVMGPQAGGFTLDLSLRWEPAPAWTIFGQGRDLYGLIDWRSAPYTFARVNSDTKHYDSQGYVEFSPALLGKEGNAPYVQRLKPHGTVGAEWAPTENTALGSSVFITDVESYWSLSARRGWFGDLWISAQAVPLQRALGMGLKWRQLDLSLLSDGFNIEHAHLLEAHLGLAWTFR